MSLSFDELLDLARPKGPIPYRVKAWGGREVLLRDPTSKDVDEWRFYCNRNRERAVPFAAKLCQILLCNEAGDRVVPQDDEALEALAAGDAAGISEIAEFASTLIAVPTDDEVEQLEKN